MTGRLLYYLLNSQIGIAGMTFKVIRSDRDIVYFNGWILL